MLMMRAGFGLRGTNSMHSPAPSLRLQTSSRPAAQRMPSMMSATSAPHLPATRTGSTRPFQLMPATPTPLFVRAAMSPAITVPCQELSATSQPP